jgi:hypothetical protein
MPSASVTLEMVSQPPVTVAIGLVTDDGNLRHWGGLDDQGADVVGVGGAIPNCNSRRPHWHLFDKPKSEPNICSLEYLAAYLETHGTDAVLRKQCSFEPWYRSDLVLRRMGEGIHR